MELVSCSFHSNCHDLILTVNSHFCMLANYVYIVTGIGKRKSDRGLLKDWVQEVQEDQWTHFLFHWSMPLWCRPLAGLLTNHNCNYYHVCMFYPSANIDTILIYNFPIVTFLRVLIVQYLLTVFSFISDSSLALPSLRCCRSSSCINESRASRVEFWV